MKQTKSTISVAVVTGACGGIGTAIVRALLAARFRVVATDRDPKALAALKKKVDDSRLLTEPMDVRDGEGIARAATKIESYHGRVDLLVNCAGVHAKTPASHLGGAKAAEIVDVNLNGTLRCVSAFAPLMAAKKRGRIINIASIAGVRGAAFSAAYAASKAGVIAASRSLARELAADGITVTAVAPGFCDTAMLAPERSLVEAHFLSRVPLKRISSPEEIAEVVTFLATCRTDYVTGAVLTVDGGLSVG